MYILYVIYIFYFYRKYVLNACSSNNLDLKSSAVVTLIKFMLVSASFCKKYLMVWLYS